MVEDIGYDDLKVVDLMTQGIKIVGETEVTGIWERTEERGARCDKESLWEHAKESQRSVLKPQAISDKELADAVWESTLKEVEEGLIVGPLTP